MIYVLLYLSSIVMANWLVHTFGIISIGPLVFPAGAVVIGLTFSFRDFVQRTYGKWQCWVWMVAASVLTYFFNREVAVASVSAFVAAETIDWLVYTFTPLPFNGRLIASNAVGIPVDSFVFVWLAFGVMWPVIIGQAVVKMISSCLLLALPTTK